MSSSPESSKIDSNVLRILVATDNHLGYREKDIIRGNDSFITFEEVLQLAFNEEVDFILLGGDLFHDATPSPSALYKCMRLLRSYIFGNKPVEFEVLNGKRHFTNVDLEAANFQDPNLNISLPIFSIHGNHDDPSSFGGLSALDLFCTTGLINYFGRAKDLTHIDVHPIMIRKGDTHLALYGLSHVHDVRLARLFENEQVNIVLPNLKDIDPECIRIDELNNLSLLHLNDDDSESKNSTDKSSSKNLLKSLSLNQEINTQHSGHKSTKTSQLDDGSDIEMPDLISKSKRNVSEDGEKKVTFTNHNKTNTDPDWFHLMVLHQNHADRGPKNYLPENSLPGFLDFVIWGHEHDSYKEADYNLLRDFYVYQPGSTVATSLSHGESLQKHAAILEIYDNSFKLHPIPLKTIRPFVFQSINIMDVWDELKLSEGDVSNKVSAMAKREIEKMIVEAQKKVTNHPMQPKLPLIRLRIIYSNEDQMFNAIRLGQTFQDRVANPADIISFKKLKKERQIKREDELDEKLKTLKIEEMNSVKSMERVEDFVEKYFDQETDEDNKLEFLSIKLLLELNNQLIHYNNNAGAETLLEKYECSVLDHLIDNKVEDSDVNKELVNFHNSITDDYIQKLLNTETDIKSPIKLKENDKSLTELDEEKEEFDNKSISSSSSSINGKRPPTITALTKDDFCKMFKSKMEAPKSSKGVKKKESSTKAASSGRGRTKAVTNDSSISHSNSKLKELDITISSQNNSSKSQRTLASLIGAGKAKQKTKIKTYILSDESD